MKINKVNDLLARHKLLCDKARLLMQDKNHDYADSSDPFSNFRSFGALGILVRLSDKLARLRSYESKGELRVKSESLEDTVIDVINYVVLYMVYKEQA